MIIAVKRFGYVRICKSS